MENFRKALKERILVLDGAMGTMLQELGLQGNGELLNVTRPEAIASIHEKYIEAGADIITCNSFGANRISQSDHGLQERAASMAEASARIARQAADRAGRKVWVAGSVGPTGKSLSLAQSMDNPAYRQYNFDQMADALEEQIRALVRGGVDMILFETCFDALNTKAGLYAMTRIPEAENIPIMISASTSDKSGRTLTGQKLEAFYRSVCHASPLSFGINCSLGAADMIPLVEDISSWAACAVSCHPNAGLPNEMGKYDESPEHMAEDIRKMAHLLNIAGGCCGTTPEHIKAIAKAVEGLSPRVSPQEDNILHVSGLESVAVDGRYNFTNVGERTNVSGSRKFARIIAAGDYESGLKIAAGQIEGGASIIDVNMDDAMLDPTHEMETFLRHIANDPDVAKAALMIDSSHWDTILAGLKNAQGKCIVNSISLKDGEESFISKALEIKNLGAAVIVIAFDERGQAVTFDHKIEIAKRAYSLLTEKVGFKPDDIIFDVNVLPVGTGIAEHARYGVDFIEAVRWIKSNLPGARTSGGISNLSFSFRGNNEVREAMHSAFLFHAVAAGLDMGIVNPGMLKIYDEIEPELLHCVEDVILDRTSDATGKLVAKAQEIMENSDSRKSEAPKAENRLERPVEERLADALIKGDASHLSEDIEECLSSLGKPVKVIDGPLMAGMAKVGDLFGAGKMFLPQVVKSAKTMKAAVEILKPLIEAGSDASEIKRPSIVMATVKGDVHDIGKNITGIVMGCNGFDVHDLGVMVPKEEIIGKAEEISADMIGVSGLITPSLFQMEELCRDLASRGMKTPLLVGGAAASALHTAVKLAPLYEHVFYSSDASAAAVLAMRLVNGREAAEREEHQKQAALRKTYSSSKVKDEAAKAPVFPADSYLKGKVFEDIEARRLEIDEVMPFFDWAIFSTIWGIKAGKGREEFEKLKSDAEKEIAKLKETDELTITISVRFDLCHREGDDIVSKNFRLPMFRQECQGGSSLADFLPPVEYGFESLMGMFAISVLPARHDEGCDCPSCSCEYGSMLSRSIRLTLAEAASEWLSEELKKRIGPGMKISKPAVGYSSCPDHTLKRDILKLLPESDKLGITLLDSCAMIPDSSICAFIFVHPNAGYPEIRRIGAEAIDEYAGRRGMTEDEKRRFLGHLL